MCPQRAHPFLVPPHPCGKYYHSCCALPRRFQSVGKKDSRGISRSKIPILLPMRVFIPDISSFAVLLCQSGISYCALRHSGNPWRAELPAALRAPPSACERCNGNVSRAENIPAAECKVIILADRLTPRMRREAGFTTSALKHAWQYN